jgi:hypothetical protein
MLRTLGNLIMLGGLVLLVIAAVQLAMGQAFPAGMVFGGLGALLGGALLRDLVKSSVNPGDNGSGTADGGGDGGSR